MIVIDGSKGEGGGQILRSALTLSLLNQQPFRIKNIRGGRSKPGLRAQHLASVRAAKAVGNAKVSGCMLGSQELKFEPNGLNSDEFRFDIGTAGSCSLVLQTIFLPLALTDRPASVVVTGGTHVPWSPTFDYLRNVWLPVMGSLGYRARLELTQAGFYPRGGGQVKLSIDALQQASPLEMGASHVRGTFHGLSLSAGLPAHVALRQRARLIERLEANQLSVEVEIVDMRSPGRGSAVILYQDKGLKLFGFTALGAKGKPAERVADEAVDQLLSFLNSKASVDRFLADQLLIPLSIAPSSSRFSVEKVTNHLVTNIKVLGKFHEAEITLEDNGNQQPARINISPEPLAR